MSPAFCVRTSYELENGVRRNTEDLALRSSDAIRPTTTHAIDTTAMRTDGAFVTVPVDSVINPDQPFTIEAWVNPAAGTGWPREDQRPAAAGTRVFASS